MFVYLSRRRRSTKSPNLVTLAKESMMQKYFILTSRDKRHKPAFQRLPTVKGEVSRSFLYRLLLYMTFAINDFLFY